MHAEYLEVSETVCAAIEQAKNKGGRIIAVGTTAVRSLEAAAADGELRRSAGTAGFSSIRVINLKSSTA